MTSMYSWNGNAGFSSDGGRRMDDGRTTDWMIVDDGCKRSPRTACGMLLPLHPSGERNPGTLAPWTLDPGPWTLDPGPWTLEDESKRHPSSPLHYMYSSSSCRQQPVPSIRCIHQQSLSHHHCAISNDKSSSPKSTDVRYGRKWSLLEPLSHAASAAKNNFCMRETKQEK
mgnify:CR=1 FL=1